MTDLQPVYLRRASPELRRAIMRVQSHYFSWTEAEREAYLADISAEDDIMLRQSLFQSLFGIHAATDEALSNATDTFSTEDFTRLNSTKLPFFGVGKDSFYLNEFTGRRLYHCQTLYEYAQEEYNFQQRYQQEEPEHTPPMAYSGRLWGMMAQLFMDDTYYYAHLFHHAEYIAQQLEEACSKRIETHIPHEIAPSKTEWDMTIDAGGLEGQLQALQEAAYEYIYERFTALLHTDASQDTPHIYITQHYHPEEPSLGIIFSSIPALQAVRFRHFVDDCRTIEADETILVREVREETAKALAFVDDSYQQIMGTFDPKIVTLNMRAFADN